MLNKILLIITRVLVTTNILKFRKRYFEKTSTYFTAENRFS